MTKIELLELLKNHIVDYREKAVDHINRNRHMNALGGMCNLSQEEVDALLIDFLNFVGMKMGVDYAMYTMDLPHEKLKSVGETIIDRIKRQAAQFQQAAEIQQTAENIVNKYL